MLGKPVYFLDKYQLWRFPDSLKTPVGYVGYKYDPAFVSFAKILIDVVPGKRRIKEGDELTLQCQFRVPGQYNSFIKKYSASLNDTTRIGIFGKKGWVKDIFTLLTVSQMCKEKETTLTINPGLSKGKYYLRFAINAGSYGPTHNSAKIELLVE